MATGLSRLGKRAHSPHSAQPKEEALLANPEIPNHRPRSSMAPSPPSPSKRLRLHEDEDIFSSSSSSSHPSLSLSLSLPPSPLITEAEGYVAINALLHFADHRRRSPRTAPASLLPPDTPSEADPANYTSANAVLRHLHYARLERR